MCDLIIRRKGRTSHDPMPRSTRHLGNLACAICGYLHAFVLYLAEPVESENGLR